MATTFNSVDPRTGEAGREYAEATLDDVRAVVAAAAETHRGGAPAGEGLPGELTRDPA